jgi:hypothetical protein
MRQEAGQEKFSKALEDNSFFIEEAYNQEKRVVQHIFEAYYFAKPRKGLFFNFTQEWPAFGEKHQLSYTIPASSFVGDSISGLNDILINYRYQLADHEAWAAVAPRLSLILPTGCVKKGLGNGVVGIQVEVPVSKRLSEHFVAHINGGFTYLPEAKGYEANGGRVSHDLFSYSYGLSVIYLAQPNYNFLLECLVNNYSEFDDRGQIAHRRETILSPGLRYAINVGRLQIVPGLAIPISWTYHLMRVGAFFYLSFEHPY